MDNIFVLCGWIITTMAFISRLMINTVNHFHHGCMPIHAACGTFQLSDEKYGKLLLCCRLMPHVALISYLTNNYGNFLLCCRLMPHVALISNLTKTTVNYYVADSCHKWNL